MWHVKGSPARLGSKGAADHHKATLFIVARLLCLPCTQVVPSLKAAEVVDQWVGLRPGRVQLRLELEELDAAGLQAAAEAAAQAAAEGRGGSSRGGQQAPGVLQGQGQGQGRLSDGLKVVHCYGHGGSGLTLAWGTAGDAVQNALKALQVPV
jgi:hypothetical protein